MGPVWRRTLKRKMLPPAGRNWARAPSALSRRREPGGPDPPVFLIFQYEAVRRRSDTDYGEVYAALQTVTQNARTYFAQCGNGIVQPKDEDAFVAEILYMYFSRRSCVEDPFRAGSTAWWWMP